MILHKYLDRTPKLHEEVFAAENAAVIGDATLEKDVNLWYGAVVRADEDSVIIGEGSNVQDNATVHTGKGFPVRIGKGVTIGHNAIVHGCTVGDNTLIGMGACILNGAVIGENCIIAAGALVKEGAVIPDGSLVVGLPGKVLRETDDAARAMIRRNAAEYVRLARASFQ